MIGSPNGGCGWQIEQAEGRAQRRVLDGERQSSSGFGSDVAAVIGNRGQFMVTIREGGGVEGKTEGELSGPGRDIEMVAGLQVRKIGVQRDLSGGRDQVIARAREKHPQR